MTNIMYNTNVTIVESVTIVQLYMFNLLKSSFRVFYHLRKKIWSKTFCQKAKKNRIAPVFKKK